MIENMSGLQPVGRAVLVTPYEPERTKGTIVIPETVAERSAMIEMRAVIVAVGPACWDNETCARAMPGDKVLISKFAGVMAKGPADGKQYRLINDRDIFCKITEEKAL